MRAKIRIELAWVAFSVIAASSFAQAKTAHANGVMNESPAVGSSSGLASLPASIQPAISAALGREDSRYRVAPIQGGFHLANPGQSLSAEFTPATASIAQGAANWKMSLSAYGYGEKLNQVGAASIDARDNRVDYRRGSMTEWYVNGPIGMEQGFTLNDRPGKSDGSPLTLKIGLSGNVTPRIDALKNTLVLARNGETMMTYSGLTAVDAKGNSMKSWMELQGANLLLHVDDRTAQYPLTVDPYVQTVILSTPDAVANDQFGFSVAFNNDYAVIGVPNHPGPAGLAQGAVYVFAAPTAATTNYTAKLTASNGAEGDQFGFSVGIGPNDEIAVGAPFVNNFEGAVYTFAKPAGGFVTTSAFTAELTAWDCQAGCTDALGYSVAVGQNVIIAGAPGTKSFIGSACTYSNPSNNSTPFYGVREVGINGAKGDYFGSATAAYNFTNIVGAPFANSYKGAAYLFEPANTKLQYSTVRFTAPDGTPGDQFGNDVSADGPGGDPAVVAVGAPFNNSEKGAVYIFAKPAKAWASTNKSNAKITSPAGLPDGFGFSVSLTNTAGSGVLTVGAPGNNNFTGNAYAYDRPSSGWVTTSTPVAIGVPNPVTPQSQEYFGWSIRQAPNGNVLVGAPYINALGTYASAPAGLGYVYTLQ